MSQLVAQVVKAEQLLAAGRAAEALAIAQRLLPKGPTDPGLNSLMTHILLKLGRYDQAEFYARRALAAEPANSALLLNLATTLNAGRKFGEALEVLRRAVAADPRDAKARLGLANALMDAHDCPGAAEHLRAGMAMGPDAQLAVSYAGALLTMGYIEEVVEFTRGAIAQFPNELHLTGGLALAMTYLYGADPDATAEAHRAYGRLLDALRPRMDLPFRGTRDPERRLRVGIVSPDLRRHSVSFFIEPYFQMHDRAGVELVAYSGTRDPDEVTARLRACTALWRDVANHSDIELAALMQEDRIDVAVDLAGHTLGNHLPAFNLRPAPVQVTYCGYPDTTGVSRMDYRVVDSFTDPKRPEVDARATERLWRLDPCFLCYRPLESAPEPWRDPAYPGPVFGSFNASRKINRGLIALWARLLRETPGSRMILKSFDFIAKGAAERIGEEFARAGIGGERLTFMAATKSLSEHLALYSRMDVALDAFPYHGTTTTCEALWMGVPVVTLAGRTHAGRVGVSLLSNAGASELIAGDEDAYVRIARETALDASRLAAYRGALRGRVAGSPICDAPAFAARFGAALRSMWRAWCAG